MTSFDSLFPPGNKRKDVSKMRSDIVGRYACDDADYTHRLHKHFYPRVQNSFIYKLERRLWPVVQEIEDNGFSVDVDYLMGHAARLREEAYHLEQAIYQQASDVIGHSIQFNIHSQQELSDILFGAMGIKPVSFIKKTEIPATDESALRSLANQGHKIAEGILVYRSLMSVIDDIGNGLPKSIIDGRIHTNYLQWGATTGRFSSSNPSMQNVAKEKAWQIRWDDKDIINTSGGSASRVRAR